MSHCLVGKYVLLSRNRSSPCASMPSRSTLRARHVHRLSGRRRLERRLLEEIGQRNRVLHRPVAVAHHTVRRERRLAHPRRAHRALRRAAARRAALRGSPRVRGRGQRGGCLRKEVIDRRRSPSIGRVRASLSTMSFTVAWTWLSERSGRNETLMMLGIVRESLPGGAGGAGVRTQSGRGASVVMAGDGRCRLDGSAGRRTPRPDRRT